jgi:hypothetical protein
MDIVLKYMEYDGPFGLYVNSMDHGDSKVIIYNIYGRIGRRSISLRPLCLLCIMKTKKQQNEII